MRKFASGVVAVVAVVLAMCGTAFADTTADALQYCTPGGGPLGLITDTEHTVLLAEQPLPAGVRSTRETVDGISTPVMQTGPAGASEAIVFLHGNPGSSRDFDQLLTAGGPGARAVAFDMPGFGHGDKPFGGTYTRAGAVQFFNDMLAHLGITRVHLVLHDLGGPWALTWAATHTDQLASVTLIDTGVLTNYIPHPIALVFTGPVTGELDMAATVRPSFHAYLQAQNPRPLPSAFLDRMYDDYNRAERCAVLGYYRDLITLSAPAQFAAQQQVFAKLKLPALVIWGSNDTYVPSSQADNQRNSFPSAEVHVLPNTGHWPFVDEPDVTRSLMVSFFRRVLGPSPARVRGRAASGAGFSRQTAAYTFTTSALGAPTGFNFSVDFRNPADPAGKPYSVSEWIIKLPAGMKLDQTVVPRCTASDAELLVEGASACPAASKVGGGTLITDAGSPAGLPRNGDNTVTQFNAPGQFIGYAETTVPPTRAVSRTTIDGDTLTTPLPTFPGFPPPDPYLAFKTVRLSGPAIVKDGRATARTPATCPPVGYWTTTLTFIYHDGVSQTVKSRSPCSP